MELGTLIAIAAGAGVAAYAMSRSRRRDADSGANEGQVGWPADWPKVAPAIHDAAHEASETFGVPLPILYGIMRKESVFRTKLLGYKNADPSSPKYSAKFAESYARNKDKKIPGSSMTWGEMFSPEQWTAWGLCQLIPFNLVGVKYGVKAGAPVENLYDVRTQLMCTGDLLKKLYDKAGNWETAVKRYNGAESYKREVLAFAEQFKAAQGSA